MRRKKKTGLGKKRWIFEIRKIQLLYLLIAFLLIIYGFFPSDKEAYFGFKAFAYTCTISSITESSNYAYASGTNVYYANLGTGTFTVNVDAATNIGDCEGGTATVYNVQFPNTVSSGGLDSASPWAWSYTFTSGNTNSYLSQWVTCTYQCTYNGDVWYPSMNSINTFNVYYDSAAPTIGAPVMYAGTRTGDSSGSYFKGTISIRSTISDSGSGILNPSCMVSINGGAWTSSGVTQDASYCYYNNYAPGADFNIKFNVSDNTGRTSASSTSTFYYDATAPTTSVSAVLKGTSTSYTFNTWTKSNITVNGSYCSDAGSGCYATHVCVDSSNSCIPSSNPIPIDVTCSAGSVCTQYVRYNSTDALANYEITKSSTILIDMQSPTTTATAVNSTGASYTFNTWTKSPYVNVTLTCNDASGSGCSLTQYCTDTTNTCTPTTTYTAPIQINTQGTTYIRYNSTDNAGNTETTQSKTIKIDTTAPTTSINPNGQSCSATQPSVTLSCSDSYSGCSATYYKIVSAATTCDTTGMSLAAGNVPVNCTQGSYCTNKICTYSVDNVGNSESVVSSNIYYIDLAGPNAPTGLSPSGSCLGTSTPSLSWSAPSDVGCSSVAGYQVEIYTTSDCSGTALQTGYPSSNSWIPSALSTGTYSWRVKAKDALNNWGSWSACALMYIDVSAPSTTISPNGRAWNNTDVTGIILSASQVGCGSAGSTYYKVVSSGTVCNTSGMSTYAAPFDITCPAGSVCTYKVCYYSTDIYGNTETLKSSNIYYIDKQNPNCSVSAISEDSGNSYQYVSGTTIYYSNTDSRAGSFTVNVSASDGSGSGIAKVYFPETVSSGFNDTAAPYSLQYSWDSSDTYSGTATIYVYDSVNNYNSCTFTIVRDISAPSGGSINYFSGVTNVVNQQINVSSGSDSESGVYTAQLYRQSAVLNIGDYTCGAYGALTAVGNSSPIKDYVLDTLSSGYCYKYIYNVSDNVGNVVSYTSSNEIKVDTNTPSIIFVPPTDGDGTATNRNYTFINVTSDKVLSSAVLEWSGTNESMLGSGNNWYKNKTGLAQGLYTYKVYGNDSANNWGKSLQRSIIIDWTSPATSFNPLNQSCSAAQPTVNITCTDNLAGCNKTYYKIINSTQTCNNTNTIEYTTPIQITCPAGQYCQQKICAYSTDLAANQETIKQSGNYTTDLAGPNPVTGLNPTNNTLLNQSSITFSWNSASDIGCAGISNYTINIYSDEACTSLTHTNTTTLTTYAIILSDGTYYWKVAAADALGNMGSWSNCTKLIVDTTPPNTSFVPNSQSCSAAQPTINITCTDNLAGCNKTYYKIINSTQTCNNTNTIEYTTPIQITCPAGQYCQQKICAYSTDLAANQETIKQSGNYTTDLAGPNPVTGLNPTNNTMTNDDTPTLSWNAASDIGCAGISSYHLEIYNGSGCSQLLISTSTTSTEYNTAHLEDGNYSWRVYAVDAFGNIGAWSNCSIIKIHTQGPPCAVTSISENSAFAYTLQSTIYYNNKSSGAYTVNVEVNNSGSGIANVTFPAATSPGGVDSVSPYFWDYNFNLASSYSGTATIYAYDTIGNNESCSFSVYLDNVNPALTILGVPTQWQASDATISIECSDSGAGCNNSRIYYFMNQSGAHCPPFSEAQYHQYNTPFSVSAHTWMCGYVEDYVNNSNLSSPIEIRVDEIPPTSLITGPAAGSWFSSDFEVSTASSDSGGSGLNKCYYKVISSGVQTVDYTEYPCNSNITITVGSGKDCRYDGVDACEVQIYSEDVAGNPSEVDSRNFSIEFGAPQITIYDPGCSFDLTTIYYDIWTLNAGISSCSYEWSADGVSWNQTGFSSSGCVRGENNVLFNTSLCRASEFGNCTVRINATSVAGVTGSANFTFEVDNKAPQITILSTSSTEIWYGNLSTANITTAISENGCLANSCYYALSTNNGSSYGLWKPMSCNSVKNISIAEECPVEGLDICKVKVYANDSEHSGNEDEMAGAWDIDFTPPTTVDNVKVPSWDNWIVYLDTYYSNYYSNVTLNCSDSASGCNRTYYCTYNIGNESECSPNIESYHNPTQFNISCAFNSICTKKVRYYSVDTAGNSEQIKTSEPIYIAVNSYVNNTNASNSQVYNWSDVRYANLENSVVDGCYVRNSVIINSTIVKNADYTTQCRIINSVITNSKIVSSEVVDSVVDESDITGSRIEYSNVFQTIAYYSIIRITQMPCGGFGMVGSVIRDGILTSGYVRYGDYVYYAPKNISEICTGMLPRPVGTLIASPAVVRNGSVVNLTYIGNDVGFSVFVNYSELNYEGSLIELKDDGIYPDLRKDDGVYTGSIVVNMDGDGVKILRAEINDNVRNVLHTNTTVILDNTPPYVQFKIDGGKTNTTTRHVVLNIEFRDANGVSACRYANEDLNWTAWEACSSTKAWLLSSGSGVKYVFVEVMDVAGNIATVNDSILLMEGVYDTTPPENLTVIDDGNYTNSNSTLHARWSAFDRESKVFYLYRIEEADGACVPISGSCGWQDALDASEVTVNNLTLEEGRTYRFCVIAQNAYFINSSEVCSDGITTDFTNPRIDYLHGSIPEGSWSNSNLVLFSWNATDPESAGVSSGIYAYSYVLDSKNDTTPDEVPEGVLGMLNNETNTAFSNLKDGVYYFHVRARDLAGNWGPARHYEIRIDRTPPTTPFMLNSNQSTNTNVVIFNWLPAMDYASGVAGYYLSVYRTDTGAYILNNSWIGNVTTYHVSAINGVTYHAYVRAADNAGNIGFDSDVAGATYDNEPPKITFKKPIPEGIVVSNQPILTLDTDEYASCSYNGVEFAYTNSTHHESRVTVLEGQTPTFSIICSDRVGNQVSDFITFTVNTSVTPDSIEIISVESPAYANIPVRVVIQVKKSGVVLQELDRDRFHLWLNGSELKEFSIISMGANYTLTFLAPAKAGLYSLVVGVDSLKSSSKSLEVSDLSLLLMYEGALSSTKTTEKMTYAVESNHSIGIASDSSKVITESSSGQLSVYSDASGSAYIFIVKPEEKPESRTGYLKSGKFQEIQSPAFGYRITADKYFIKNILSYSDILLNMPRELGPGTHTLIIKNNGLLPDGRVNISISVVS
ncbi:MAG: hypothetical protein QXJ50_04555 [Candidatus Woesearchaeota archaeon]